MSHRLFKLLEAYEGGGAHNQYRDCDLGLERPYGAEIRKRNLDTYLDAFAGARYVLVGEAAGYAGCRFSGIPFTGEAQIVGESCLPWARDRRLEQSSLDGPWRERSGQIVWEALGGRRDCVLWNAFPWHPHADTPLTNRKPTRQELRSAEAALACMLSLFPRAQVLAIGRVSQEALSRLGIQAPYIRHPSHGGKRAFIEGVATLPRQEPLVVNKGPS
jgi:uracil-DNA glycosylase